MGRRRNEDESPLIYLALAIVCFAKGLVLISFSAFIAKMRAGMADRTKEDKIVVEHNGHMFRFNEVVHAFEGMAPGLPGKKTEFTKAWFKGVDKRKEKIGLSAGLSWDIAEGPFRDFLKGRFIK